MVEGVRDIHLRAIVHGEWIVCLQRKLIAIAQFLK
jgi:hypothetical protein